MQDYPENSQSNSSILDDTPDSNDFGFTEMYKEVCKSSQRNQDELQRYLNQKIVDPRKYSGSGGPLLWWKVSKIRYEF